MKSSERREARSHPEVSSRRGVAQAIRYEIQILDHSHRLPGTLSLPSPCLGWVIFAHGSGSSRFSPRNIQVANELNHNYLGTLLFDLLTLEESEDRGKVFDIEFLAQRLVIATRFVRSWQASHQLPANLPLGFFGASTGAGAALLAAADLKTEIAAVVSRGGRPDLALARLPEVSASTLLIVGGRDDLVLSLNQKALRLLQHGNLVIIPEASHLFEEPGTLELMTEHAKNWFLEHFQPQSSNLADFHPPETL